MLTSRMPVVKAAGRSLSYEWIEGDARARPTLIFLHEGLGSIRQWRDFPPKAAAATGCRVLVYDRYGYRQPEVLAEPRRDGTEADRLDEDVRRHRHHAAGAMSRAGMDEGDRGAVRMPYQDRVLDGETPAQLRQRDERLVVHEANIPARLGEHLGLAVAVAVVDEHPAAGGGGRFRRKVAPLADRAQPFVEKKQGRPGPGVAFDPFVAERAPGRFHNRHARG